MKVYNFNTLELNAIYKGLIHASNLSGLELSSAIIQNRKLIEDQGIKKKTSEFTLLRDKKREPIIEKYAKKDKNGNIIMKEDGAVQFNNNSDLEKAQKEIDVIEEQILEELGMNKKKDISLFEIDKEWFKEDITAAVMNLIFPIIKF